MGWRCLVVAAVALARASAAGIEGTVTGVDGQPAVGMPVYVQAWDEDSSRLIPVETGPEGHFRCEHPPAGMEFSGRVLAYAPSRGVAVAGEPVGQPLALRLQPLATLEGLVQDADGRPLAGVEVFYHWVREPGELARVVHTDEALQARLRAVTGADGRWVVRDAPAWGRLVTRHPDYVDAWFDRRPDRVENPPVALTRAGALTGRVTHEDDGTPAAQVTVVAYNAARDSPGLAQTDADGRFRIDRRRPGGYVVCLREAHDSEWTASPAVTAAAAAQTTEGVGLVLTHGVVVHGRVLDTSTRLGVKGAWVTVTWEGEPCSVIIARATSDADGRYQLRVPPVEVTVRAGPPEGYRAGDGAARKLVVKPGDEPRVDLPLESSEEVVGAVVDEQGRGVAGAEVLWWDRPGEAPKRLATEPDGSFVLEQPPLDGSPLWARAGARGVEAPVWVAATGRREPVRLVVKLVAGATIAGRVVDARGEPMAGMTVSLEADLRHVGGYRPGRVDQVTTGPDGRYRFERIEPWWANLRVEPWPEAHAVRKAATIPPQGADRAATDIVLVALSATMRGKVVTAAGQPADGATVAVLTDGYREPTVTQPDGTFEVQRVPDEPATVIAVQGLRLVAKATGTPGTELVLRLGAVPPVALAPTPEELALGRELVRQAQGGYTPEAFLALLALAVPDPPADEVFTTGLRQAPEPARAVQWIARRDPVKALRVAPLLARLRHRSVAEAWAEVAWRLPPDHAADAARLYADARRLIPGLVPGELDETYAHLAAAAERVGLAAEADEWLQRLVDNRNLRHWPNTDMAASFWLGRFPRLLDRLLAAAPAGPARELERMAGLYTLAQTDPRAAQARLGEPPQGVPQRLADEALVVVAGSLAAVDEAAATQMLARIVAPEARAIALVRAAHSCPARAAAWLQEAASLHASPSSSLEAARDALYLAPALAPALYGIGPGVPLDGSARTEHFYLAYHNPARALLFTEQVLDATRWHPNDWAIVIAARTLCPLDVKRAVEVAELLRAGNAEQYALARYQVAEWLLAPDRRFLSAEPRRELAW